MSTAFVRLQRAVEYAVNRLDADTQVAGDLAVALAIAKDAMTWEGFQASLPDPDYSEILDDSDVTELLETGSVTVTVRGPGGRVRSFVISVSAEEIPNG
jgi:hypothetical protein